LIESVTLRMEGHAVHDDAFYVPGEMLSAWAGRDPVERYRAWLGEHAAFTDAEDEALLAEVTATLRDGLRRAEASPLPDPATLTDGVYAA
jgi:pyruvate dehydrogenase E1 component alpha subunit